MASVQGVGEQGEGEGEPHVWQPTPSRLSVGGFGAILERTSPADEARWTGSISERPVEPGETVVVRVHHPNPHQSFMYLGLFASGVDLEDYRNSEGEAYPRLLYFSSIGNHWSGVHDSFHSSSTHSDDDWVTGVVPPLADGDVVGIRQDATTGRIELYRNRVLVYTTPHAFPLATPLHLYGALAFDGESFTILDGAEALGFHVDEHTADAADAIEITNDYVFFDTEQRSEPLELPVKISFSFRLDAAESAIYPCWSCSKLQWGRDGVDALSWFMSDHRHDFTFRTQMFGGFPDVERAHDGFDLVRGRTYRCEAELLNTSARYSINGHLYATCTYAVEDVPQSGWFGFGVYHAHKSYTVWDIEVAALLPPLASMPTVTRQISTAPGEENCCPVCFEPYEAVRAEEEGGTIKDGSVLKVVTECNHTMCYKCVREVCKMSGDVHEGVCPMCRAPIQMESLRRAVDAPPPEADDG